MSEESFDRQVARVRTTLGLSQRQFAERYHIPLGTLRGWEQGRRRNIDIASKLLITLIDLEPELVARALKVGT